MAASSDTIQMIARLAPLADVLAMVDLDVKPVTPRTAELTAAAGCTLAVDAMAPARPMRRWHCSTAGRLLQMQLWVPVAMRRCC